MHPHLEDELLELLLMGDESTELLLDMLAFEAPAGPPSRKRVEQVLADLAQRGWVDRSWLDINGMEDVADAQRRCPLPPPGGADSRLPVEPRPDGRASSP